MARPLVARATGYRMDLESENFVIGNTLQSGGHSNNPLDETLVAHPLRASDGHHGWSGGRGDGDDNFVVANPVESSLTVADPLSTREGKTYTHEGKNNFRGHNLVYGLRPDAARNGEAKTPSVDAEGRVRLRDPGFNVLEEMSPTLEAAGPPSVGGAGVRRLTPLECERLQGFPDNWTNVRVNGRTIADSHRYRMLGNAVATVCAQWLGHRLVEVDACDKS